MWWKFLYNSYAMWAYENLNCENLNHACADYRDWISPPRTIYREQTDEIFLGTCPITMSPLQTATVKGSKRLPSSRLLGLINNSTPYVFINVISLHHSFYLKRCPFSSALRCTKKEQLIFTLATIKVEVQLKKTCACACAVVTYEI